MTAKETQIEALLRQVEENLKRIKQLEAEPDDDFHEGAIVIWSKTFTGHQTYNYFAMKLGDQWLVAGRLGWMDWTQLARHLSRADAGTVYYVTELTPLPELEGDT